MHFMFPFPNIAAIVSKMFSLSQRLLFAMQVLGITENQWTMCRPLLSDIRLCQLSTVIAYSNSWFIYILHSYAIHSSSADLLLVDRKYVKNMH